MIHPRAETFKSEAFSLMFYRTAFFCLAGVISMAALVTLSYILGLKAQVRDLRGVAEACGMEVEP